MNAALINRISHGSGILNLYVIPPEERIEIRVYPLQLRLALFGLLVEK